MYKHVTSAINWSRVLDLSSPHVNTVSNHVLGAVKAGLRRSIYVLPVQTHVVFTAVASGMFTVSQ